MSKIHKRKDNSSGKNTKTDQKDKVKSSPEEDDLENKNSEL